jgi:hypothetical protein
MFHAQPSSSSVATLIKEVLDLAALVRDLKERIEVLEQRSTSHTHGFYLAKNDTYHHNLTLAPTNPQ